MVALEEPDKGYAWVVLIGACIINMILSGMARMIGLLYVAIIDAYGVTRKEASVPFSVRNAVRYMAGPLAGVLGQTYGIRTVTFWGGLIAAAGSILCAFAPSVEWIVLWWGVVHGLGFALANTLFQVVINQYFEKHRASASGIVLSGACFAALIFPLMIDAMLNTYGIFGCFLLLGGLFLNVLPPSLVLKMPPWVEFPEAYARKRLLLSKLSRSEVDNKTASVSVIYDVHSTNTITEKVKLYSSLTNSKYIVNGFNSQPAEANCRQPDVVCKLYHSINSDELQSKKKFTKVQVQKGIANPVFIPDSETSYNQIEEKYSTQEMSANRKQKENFIKNLQKIPRLYLNSVYNLISLSIAVYFAVFIPILTVIVDYTRDKGIPKTYEQFLIHSLTVGDLLGRLGFGWVTDRQYLSFANFMVISFVAKGIFISLLPISRSLPTFLIVVGLYGITAGTVFTYIPVLVHNYVEKDKQSLAIGCVGLFSSIATFGIPPLIGYFRDSVGSYDGLFYILAALSAIPAALWLVVSLSDRCCRRNQIPTHK